MKNYKKDTIYIYHILKDYSDENHILKMKEIVYKLKSLYGVSLDRKTIYSNIKTLQEVGIEISDYKNNGVGYYLITRMLEKYELALVMDSLNASQAITDKQTKEIIAKLQNTLSIYERKKYKHLRIVKNNKSLNKEVFLNIEIIAEAIEKKKKVAFTYCKYDFDKTIKPRKNEKYVLNPYLTISDSERYYLICRLYEGADISFYRIDLMVDIEIIDEDIDVFVTEEELENAYLNTKNAWYDEPQKITIKCQNHILGNVIDDFGKDIDIKKNDDDTFIVTLNVAPPGVVFWALKYLSQAEVLSPKSVREKIVKTIKHNDYIECKIP